MKSKSFVTAVLAVAALSLCMSSARADKKADEAKKEQARVFYAEGTKAYNLGNFELAIKNYKDAYNALPEPVFLYNIAQAYRLAGDFNQALFFYKSFMRNMPTAPNIAEVERRVAEMEAALEQQKSASSKPPNDTVGPGESPRGSDPAPAPSPAPSPAGVKIPSPAVAAGTVPADTSPSDGPTDSGGGSKPIYKKWWFWAGIGAVAVGTVAIVAVSSGGGGDEAPDSHFGSYKIY